MRIFRKKTSQARWNLKVLRIFLNFCIRTSNLTNILNPQQICADNFWLYIEVYIYMIYIPTKYKENWRTLLILRPTQPHPGIKHFPRKKKVTVVVWFWKCQNRFLTQTRPIGLAVVCEHWTPKGDCKVTGNEERN